MDFDVRGGQNVLKNIQAQLNGTYSLGKPIKRTILANEYNGFSRFFHAELAKQPAKFTQTGVEVSLLVPESAPIKDWDKRRLEENGVAIVKAKKRPCFPVPIDWLSYPPEKLKSGIVIGIGARLGKIAQHWKERYQYKKIYIDQGNERPLGSCYKVVETYEDLEDYRKKLSIAANFSVPIGPKTTDDLSASLRSERKQVFNLASGIFSHFSNSNHVANDGRNFRVQLLGGDNSDNFFKDGLKTAADAVAELENNSYDLVYVRERKATEQQFKDLFHKCGVSKSQLRIRNLPKTEDQWKKLFCVVDLAIMPSDDKEFGLEALLALSAGRPVLVHGESGFGEALRDVTFGTSAIVDSDDARECATNDGRNFRVLLLGGDNPDNFFKDGLKTAADAVAELKNNSYHLIYVGAGKGTEQQFKDLFHKCGVSKSQLRIRNLPKTEDEWKKLFCEVDLAIMPSDDKEFALEALLALSAGRPVLVHGESGFGEALRDVTFGTSAIVDSDDAREWASRIKTMSEKDKKIRLEEAAMLRSNYDEKYSWEKQCGVSKSQLRIRNLPKTEDQWKKLFCVVDLAIMPSDDKEFGLEALLALSAGRPVLVHGESGFGEALRDVTFGTSAIVDSDDARECATNDGRNFRVLLLGGDNPDNFFKDGLKTAADAVAELKNNSYHLIYVGAGKGTEQQFKDLFHKCGVSKSQLRIRNLPKTEDEWKKLFCEVDLAIMPSDDKEFALEALLALSAGRPVLVHGESGFGEALRDVTFGTSAIVDSDDAREWASRIKTIREKDKKTRLEEAAMLRANYDEKYSWEKQLTHLVAMM